MADQKISELTALTGANVADDDAIAIVDTSATETKKIVFSELKNALDTATGFVRITGDTMTGALDVQSTITADGLTIESSTPIVIVKENTTGYMGFRGQNDSGNFYFGIDNSAGSFYGSAYARVLYADGSYPMVFYTNATERMRIDSSGNVGIGTDLPAQKLHVNGGQYTGLRLETTNALGASYIDFGDNSDADVGGIVYWHTDNSMRLITNAAERMRIDSSGNVGIGTDLPSAKLHVYDASTDAVVYVDSGNANGAHMRFLASGSVKHFVGSGGGFGLGDVDDYAIRSYDNILFSTGNSSTERMRIDSSGNVLVGRTTSTLGGGNGGLLQIGSASASGSGAGLTIHSGTAGLGDIQFADGTTGADSYRGLIRYDHSTNNMSFRVNAAEAMRIDSSGNLLVGKTSLGVSTAGAQIESFGLARFVRNGGETLILNRLTSDGDILSFQKDGSTVGSISVTGSSTSYNTSSDHRLKENVVNLTGATERLKQLNPSRFNFIADADTTVDGFLAHEVQSVVPEAITGAHNEVDADGNPVYQGIDQSKLVPLLVATIQELEARITALENA